MTNRLARYVPLSGLDRLPREHRLPRPSHAGAGQPRHWIVRRRLRFTHRLYGLRLRVAEESALVVERLQTAAVAQSRLEHLVEEYGSKLTRVRDLVSDARLLRVRPQRAGAAVDCKEPRDRIDAKRQILLAGEEDARHVT